LEIVPEVIEGCTEGGLEIVPKVAEVVLKMVEVVPKVMKVVLKVAEIVLKVLGGCDEGDALCARCSGYGGGP